MPRVLVLHAVGFALGIAAGGFFHIPVPGAFCLALAALVFSLVILYRSKDPRLLVIFSLCVGILWGQIKDLGYSSPSLAPGERIQAVGMVAEEPRPTGAGKIFSFRLHQIENDTGSKNKINVICGPEENVHYGDILKISGQVLESSEPSNPHQFDYDAYLKRQGIGATVSTLYGGRLEQAGENQGNIFFRAVINIKDKTKRVLAHLPEKQQAFVGGMLFGEKGNLSYEDRNVLSQTGLMDAFAVSGVHVGYVVLFTMILAQVAKLPQWGRLILVSFTVLFYAALSEFTPSVMRSGFMAVMGLVAYSLGEKKDVFTALAAAALPLLIYRPQMLFDAGFQLSFFAAWGVVYLLPVIRDWFPQKGAWWEALAGAVSAQLAIMPLIAYYFNVLTVSGLAIGILASGLVGIVVLLGLFSVILSMISVNLAVLPAYGAGIVVEGIWQAAKFVSEIPGSYHTVRTPGLLMIFLFYGVLISFPYLMKGKSGRWYTAISALILVILLALPVSGHGRLNVTFVDVGQGDCIFVHTPAGRTCLIDGGGRPQGSSFDVGERIVVPYLKSQGLERLDLVVLTHPHDDHMNGLMAVLRELKVGNLVLADVFLECQETQQLLELAEREKTAVIPVSLGQEIFLDRGIKLLVLHPGEPITGTKSDMNNNSLVLKLFYGNVSFVLTGDAEMECLSSLIHSGGDLEAEVLKIPHHGSKNSFFPLFYEKVSPDMVVICVGKNTFGHPAPEVVEFWQEQKIPLYRTDRDGAVILSTDGTNIWVETFKNLEKTFAFP